MQDTRQINLSTLHNKYEPGAGKVDFRVDEFDDVRGGLVAKSLQESDFVHVAFDGNLVRPLEINFFERVDFARWGEDLVDFGRPAAA